MHGFLSRGLIAAALALATVAVPIATVHACSCIEMQPAAAVEFADVAFVGTVADAEPGGQDPMMGAPLVRYAFEVERASEEIGPVIEVVALDDGGGASCGFTFGPGERWFVAAMSEGGSLQSNLCSGNLKLTGMSDAQIADLLELLPMEPVGATPQPTTAPPAAPAASAAPAPVTPTATTVAMPIVAALVVGIAAAGALGLVLVLALRRGRSS